MDVNYTPLDVSSFEKTFDERKPSHKSFDISVTFLTLIVITLAVLAILVFILIQKKVQELGMGGLFA